MGEVGMKGKRKLDGVMILAEVLANVAVKNHVGAGRGIGTVGTEGTRRAVAAVGDDVVDPLFYDTGCQGEQVTADGNLSWWCGGNDVAC